MGSRIRQFILIILLLTSCSENKIKRYLFSSDISVGDSSVVCLNTILNRSFDWYFVTGGFVFRSELSEIIGSEYKGRTPNDDQTMVIFVKDNTVIYKELFSVSLIDYYPNIEVFEKVDSPAVLFKRIGRRKFDWYKIKATIQKPGTLAHDSLESSGALDLLLRPNETYDRMRPLL